LQFRRKRRNDGTDHIDLGFLVDIFMIDMIELWYDGTDHIDLGFLIDIFMIDLWLNLCLTLLSWLRWNHVYLIFISIYLFILVEQEEMERQREEEGFRSDESRPDSPHIVVPPSDGLYLYLFDWSLLFSSNHHFFLSKNHSFRVRVRGWRPWRWIWTSWKWTNIALDFNHWWVIFERMIISWWEVNNKFEIDLFSQIE